MSYEVANQRAARKPTKHVNFFEDHITNNANGVSHDSKPNNAAKALFKDEPRIPSPERGASDEAVEITRDISPADVILSFTTSIRPGE